MTTSGSANPSLPDDAVLYQVVAARRLQWDSLLWQVPALSLAAQSFLLTIALSADAGRVSKVASALLAVVAAFLSLHLLVRHRQAEVTDAEWLADYEQRHFGETVHGRSWATRRDATPAARPFALLGRIHAMPVWLAGLSLFGLVDLMALILALFHPDALT